MQKVSAYLLERRDGMESLAARASEAARLRSEVEAWLRTKGATEVGPRGTYLPEDGSSGVFFTDDATEGDDAWWMVQLREETIEGRIFGAAVSITMARNLVSVYATMEVGSTAPHIMPVPSDPRCPRVVRSLLGLSGRWYRGASTLRSLQPVTGFEAGETLAAEIEHPDRTVPFVAVSRIGGGVALPELDSKLEYDLSGLANIVVVDEEASWALTDALGDDFACFWGAVRVYWPGFSRNRDRYSHSLWTAERLRSIDGDAIVGRELFRRRLRELIFRAAALSIVRPDEIDEIRNAAAKRALGDLRQKAKSLAEFEALADSYASDNDNLRAELALARTQLGDLGTRVAQLEGERQALVDHLRASKAAPDETPTDPVAPVVDHDGAGAPAAGAIRFYKKVHSKPTHDVMTRVGDCGCNNWQGAFSADKARKGIAKLEGGRSDWKSMQHCAACTGGGMWRVRW